MGMIFEISYLENPWEAGYTRVGTVAPHWYREGTAICMDGILRVNEMKVP